MGNEAFDIFVSYARADSRHAADIVSVLRARGLTFFYDRSSLPPGLPWIRELEKALNVAKAAIILIGPYGLGNTQEYERDLAIFRQTRDPSFPIVPVILPDTRIDRPYNFLNILTWIDFSQVSKVSDAPAEIEQLLAAVQRTSVGVVREAICPYRGLDAFREEDSLFFYGRGTADDPQSTIGQLVRKVREHPFVMVVGRSGSGKSSLVYAGLVPALRRARDNFWNVLTLRPGPEPLRALAAAFNPKADAAGSAEYVAKISAEAELLRTGAPELLAHMIREQLDQSEGKPDRLMLYVDQWEELYAQAPSPAETDRAARHAVHVNRFIDLLLNASQSAPVSVVATVRADFYDPLISHHEIRALLPTQQVLLGSMSRSDLESTIVEPARMAGLTFDPPKLVASMLDEAGEDEGMLPLLQYALKETWALRKGTVMTGDAYARSGGVREAIQRTAEQAFEDLSDTDQQAARKLFLRLVTPGEGQEDTRARATMPDEQALRRIVDQFAGPRTRLLVTGSDRGGRPTVEVAHEALIRTWPRLRQWINANRDKLRARAAIVQAKADWDQQGRNRGLLLRSGFQLERARLLVADPGDIAIDDIKGFIAESDEADTRQRAEEAARERQRQAAELEAANAVAVASRRVARRTLAGLAAALVLALIAIGTGIYARSQTVDALRQKAEAEKQSALAEANFREGQKTESHFRAEQAKEAGADAVTAALLALEGLPDANASDSAQRTRPFINEAWYVLYRARLKPLERKILGGHTAPVNSAVFAPDGDRILTASDDNTARLWDRDGKSLSILAGHTATVIRAVFAPDGRRILTASYDDTARLWDRDGKPLATLKGHTDTVSSAVFAPDGGRILTASDDNTARLWDRDGKPLTILEGHTDKVSSAVFAPNGGRILTASYDHTARLWDREGKLLAILTGHTDTVNSAVFAPDGGRILTASNDHTARLWNRDGKPLTILEGHTAQVESAVFAPESGRILTVSDDHTARLWDRDGKLLAILEGHTDAISSAVFGRDGGILTASFDHTARLWDRDGKPLAILAGHDDTVNSAVFAPNSGRILTASSDRTARLWDREGKPPTILKDHTSWVDSAVFAPDGSRILTASYDNTARLWDREGKPLAILKGHTGQVISAVFASDGGRILTASKDHTARLWHRDGRLLAILEGHTDAVNSVEFATDGGRILTASTDGTARLWGRDGELLATLAGHTAPVNSAVFAPDGGRILTASADGTARLWDRDGKLLAILQGHIVPVSTAVFAPDGGRILTASYDSTAQLWDRDGKPLAILAGHTAPVNSAVFAPDGGHILTASNDHTARLWDRDGKPLAILEGHTAEIHSAVFAPDGDRILTASFDRTARLWDREGKPLAILEGHTDVVRSAVFAPDGGRILTASFDDTARLWEAFPKTQTLIDHVKAEMPRCLTSAQRERLFLAPTPPDWCATMHKWPYDATP